MATWEAKGFLFEKRKKVKYKPSVGELTRLTATVVKRADGGHVAETLPTGDCKPSTFFIICGVLIIRRDIFSGTLGLFVCKPRVI